MTNEKLLDFFVMAALDWEDARYWLSIHQGKPNREKQTECFKSECSERKGKFLAYRDALLDKLNEQKQTKRANDTKKSNYPACPCCSKETFPRTDGGIMAGSLACECGWTQFR